MRYFKWLNLLGLAVMSSLAALIIANGVLWPGVSSASNELLQPAPTQTVGSFDYFGQQLTRLQAAQLVLEKGLNPLDPRSYQRIGAVQITQNLIDQGEDIFLNRKIGDDFGFLKVFGFDQGIDLIRPELTGAIARLRGRSTNNLVITLQKNITVGGRTFNQGSRIPTGLDVKSGSLVPIGLSFEGDLTCAACHVSLTDSGQELDGVPNGNLNVPLFVALASNSAAGFARLGFDPLDPQYQGNGKTIIDSNGQLVELPDPDLFETAFDAAVLNVPLGQFESSPDGINNTTQIPSIFTFGTRPFGFDGNFAVGPFGGLSAINNAVHSSEVNLTAAAQTSFETLGIDPEVYLGTILQNAADPALRLPDGAPVKPSQWIQQVAPNRQAAELEDQIPAPGTGSYPSLDPSLFTYNGLVFSPNTNVKNDIASGPFLFAANAMSAWQNSLLPPPNKSPQNREAIQSGAVERGAQVFEAANCVSCHAPPFFTDNVIHPVAEIGTNPARGQSRLGLNDLLVPPQIYTLDTPVPPPSNAEVLDVPTEGIAADPTSLPTGLLPDGGYKTLPLRGLHLSAPYLHDGGVAVRAGTLSVDQGNVTVVDATGLGLTGTLSKGLPADSASSLFALIDRDLRQQVIAANQSNPALVSSNLTGEGHEFYVDAAAGYTRREQADLIKFLLALDDNPGQF